VNTIRPRTVIEEVELDGLPVPLPAGVLKIPPGRRGITIRFTGLSFADADKVRFRHRLGGLETGWQDAGNTRSVSYNYLPPGEYRFEVLACNNDGLWSPQPAVQLLTVLPFFWQTWWFRAAITLLVLAAAVLTGRALTRRRMKQRLEKAEQQHAIERERARIARDIHDDLGASLTRITLLSQSARSDMENPLRVAKGLDQIYGTAREVTRALDEIVWAVNPKHDTLDSLAVYLGKFAQDYLQAANVRCRLDLPLELPLWHLTAEVRHNVFLAFKETLNNILKHSEASEVRITLTTDARTRTFTLAIEDDGRGFAAPTSNAHSKLSTDRVATGNGLGNLQARLAEVGGRYEVSSESGKGTSTRVVLTLRAPSGESGRRVV
jgi:signal transduction histidine kinase